MTQLTMCKNYNCRIRGSCIRYCKAPTKTHQAYYHDIPGDEETCSCFVPIRKGDTLRQLKDCDYYAQVGNITDDDVY